MVIKQPATLVAVVVLAVILTAALVVFSSLGIGP